MSRARSSLLAACTLALACAACRSEEAARGAVGKEPAPVAAEPVQIALSSPHLRFTYLGKDGRFAMAQRASEVPKDARGVVMVVDLQQTRNETDAVWVVDLRGEPPAERVLARAMPRPEFERQARAQREGDRPPVVMYATSWCGVCRSARKFLEQHKVRYQEHDIERDPRAAAQLREKARKAGVDARGVPVFDVAGRIVPGFDEALLRQLLKL